MRRLLNDPAFHIHFNQVMLCVWLALVIPTLLFWRESIFWVATMSIYANIVGHLSALMASLAERKADQFGNEGSR